MLKKIVLFLFFALISVLIAAHYEIIPSPWLDEGKRTLNARDNLINKSDRILNSETD